MSSERAGKISQRIWQSNVLPLDLWSQHTVFQPGNSISFTIIIHSNLDIQLLFIPGLGTCTLHSTWVQLQTQGSKQLEWECKICKDFLILVQLMNIIWIPRILCPKIFQYWIFIPFWDFFAFNFQSKLFLTELLLDSQKDVKWVFKNIIFNVLPATVIWYFCWYFNIDVWIIITFPLISS